MRAICDRRLGAAAIALAAASMAGGCNKEKEKAAPPPPPPVVVATAEARDVPVYLEAVAQTKATDTVEIRARVAGVLASQDFEEGAMLKQGAPLFRIDPLEYEAAVLAAKARLAKAEADLKLAQEQVSVRAAEAEVEQAKARLRKTEQDVARLVPLAAEDAVPKQDLDAAVAANDVSKADLDAANALLENSKLKEEVGKLVALAEVEGAKAALRQAELELGYCTMVSPIDGLIGRADVSVGSLVGQNEATVLATVSTVDPIRVAFSISETDYMMLTKRTAKERPESSPPIELTLSDGTVHPHPGKFAVVEREVDVATGTLVIEAEFPNPGGVLRPGQFGRVRAVVETLKGAVTVPQRAVIEQQSEKVLLVVGDDGKVALRIARLGRNHEGQVVVREGVKAGEKVIVEGQLRARPGTAVTITQPSPKEPPAGKRAEGEAR
jgi:membrane fusion protein (multidrug efflux system)